jgi:hypothetical protein
MVTTCFDSLRVIFRPFELIAISYCITYCNKFKRPEDDSLQVEKGSHMKFIIIYVYIHAYS